MPKERKKENILKRILKYRLIYYFFILIIIFTFIFFIFLIILLRKKENFYTFQIPWENHYLNDRNYTNYHFDSGLEVMLIQDINFDMDGGAIVINKGFMDNYLDEGIAYFATLLLNYMFYDSINKDEKKELTLDNYFGNYDYKCEEYFTSFKFDILNSGFKKYLADFSSILNPGNISKYFDDKFDETMKQIIGEMTYYYNLKANNIYYKEKHLLEHIVYGLRDENNEEILPEGNNQTINKLINKYGKKGFQDKVINYINDKLKDPSNIKIVLFSKYKFLISSKYMKKYFDYLINIKPNVKNDKNMGINNINNINKNEYKSNNLFNFKEIKKSQIIFLKGSSTDTNYIKIIYYIDKIKNETFEELFYKSNYFNYIFDILCETKKGSLYSLLSKNSSFNIKKITSNYNFVLKYGLYFFIEIELMNLNNINDIIFITYQYMNKIIKEGIGKENFQIKRYLELRDLYNQTLRYTEKSYDTMDLAYANGRNIFDTKFNQRYYLYSQWCPWEDNLSYDENIEKIINESNLYFKQIKPENSVIILGIKENEVDDITCNEKSPFHLNCSYFKDKNNIKNNINYYNISYTNITFDPSDFEKELDIGDKANITYVENIYISKHKDIIPIPKQVENNKKNGIEISNNILNTFYFKKNLNFRLPKVFISINLLHPYLRPLEPNSWIKNCLFFQILEIFSAIKKKIYEVLADAQRAGNEISFNYNENYLTIDIISYEDAAYNIVKEIKNIIYDTDWESTDFLINNEFYKNETFDAFFNLEKSSLYIANYYFLCKVKNGLYNKYEFNKDNFESIYKFYCFNNIKENIKNLTKFIVNGFIYGYCNQSLAENIAKLFDKENYEEEIINLEKILKSVNINKTVENFINWIKEIRILNSTGESISINETLVNKSTGNIGFRYISLSNEKDITKKFMKLSIIEKMFNNIIQYTNASNYLLNLEMFTYRDIYFGLFLYDSNNPNKNPNNKALIDKVFKSIIEYSSNFYKYSVDNIGDRFYYFQKNFKSVLFKKQVSFKQKGNDELKNIVYNYNIPQEEQILDEKYRFEELIQFFEKINKSKVLDVNTILINETKS